MRVYRESVINRITVLVNEYIVDNKKPPTHIELSTSEYSQLLDEVWDNTGWYYRWDRDKFNNRIKNEEVVYDGMKVVIKD